MFGVAASTVKSDLRVSQGDRVKQGGDKSVWG